MAQLKNKSCADRKSRFNFLPNIKTRSFDVIFLLKSIDTAALVCKFLAACIERMRIGTDFDRYQRIFVAVFPLDRLIRCFCRTAQKFETGACVHKYNGMVIRMDACFHLIHLLFALTVLSSQSLIA